MGDDNEFEWIENHLLENYKHNELFNLVQLFIEDARYGREARETRDACTAWELSSTGNADNSWFEGIEITNADIDPAEIDDHDEASLKMLSMPFFKKDQILEVEHGTQTN